MKFVTQKYVREYLKSKGKQTSDEVFDHIDDLIKNLLDDSIAHQEADTKKTVMGRHLKQAFNTFLDKMISKRRLE